MKIVDVVCAPGLGGYYHWDLAALKHNVTYDGFDVIGEPATPGFERIIEPSEIVSIMLCLDNGAVAFGDCVDVILAGAAGRDSLFRADEHLTLLNGALRDTLIGREVDAFRPQAQALDELEFDSQPLHTAIRYGLSQALLHATSLAHSETMAQVVSREYGCAIATTPVPILSMCRTVDEVLVDKMILKRADILPHADFIKTPEDVGDKGEKLHRYVSWLTERVTSLGGSDYRPTLHVDVYGTLGEAFDMDLSAVGRFLRGLEQAAGPLALMVECPIVAPSQAEQFEGLATLREILRDQGTRVSIVADEWVNTLDDIKRCADARAADVVQVKTPDLGGLQHSVDAILYLQQSGVGAYLGGSANETDQSARICCHVALACQADMLIAKPGQGVDEALMIERNEMNRTLALIKAGH